MISYRHHVVSLVAVFLALAIGLALGGGPLSEVGRQGDTSRTVVRADTDEVRRSAVFGDEFAAASARTLYADRLADRPVALLTMPGADAETINALVAQVELAGGRIAGRYAAQPALVDASEKSLVDTLGSQLMTQLGSEAVDTEAPTYVRMGQLIGLGIASTEPAGAAPGEAALSVRQTLVGAELLTGPRDEVATASLVLVVLGEIVDDAVLTGLTSGIASRSVGLVVAGDTAAGVDGDLAGLRADQVADELSSVDGVETALGQVTSVLALAGELSGTGGSFGAAGDDGAVPLG